MRLASLPALALSLVGACAPTTADFEAARPELGVAPPAAIDRTAIPAVRPGDFAAPAPVPPGLEVPFPCRPEGPAAAPAWIFDADGFGVAARVAGAELAVVGVEPEPTLTVLSLATGEVRLRLPVEAGLSPLAAAAGVLVLGRGGAAPLLAGLDLADGASRWTVPLPPGPIRLVSADDGPLVVREGPGADGSFRLVARDAGSGVPLWTRAFEATAGGPSPQVLRTGDRLIVAYPAGSGELVTALAAVDLASGEVRWSRRAEGRLERLLADAEGRLHAGLRAGADPAAGAGYVLSLAADGLVRWELRRATVEGPGEARLLDGPALAGPDRLLLVAADLLEGSTGATVGHAPFAAPASFRLAGGTAFGFVSRAAWYDAALYGLDLATGRPRFAMRQHEAGPHWHLVGAAPTAAGSLLAAFSVVDGSSSTAALCELDERGRAVRAVRLPSPPSGADVAAAFVAGDRWIEVIEIDRPWPDGPRVELRAHALDGFTPPAPPAPVGSCTGEASDTCG